MSLNTPTTSDVSKTAMSFEEEAQNSLKFQIGWIIHGMDIPNHKELIEAVYTHLLPYLNFESREHPNRPKYGAAVADAVIEMYFDTSGNIGMFSKGGALREDFLQASMAQKSRPKMRELLGEGIIG